MNPYEMFGTEDNLEKDGFWLDYGSFRAKVARAGGKNTLYSKAVSNELKKINKANWKGVTEEEVIDVLTSVYAKSVIKAHEVKNDKGEWVSGVYLKTNKGYEIAPFNVKNMKQILIDLPDYFEELSKKANDFTQFQDKLTEEQVQD